MAGQLKADSIATVQCIYDRQWHGVARRRPPFSSDDWLTVLREGLLSCSRRFRGCSSLTHPIHIGGSLRLSLLMMHWCICESVVMPFRALLERALNQRI
jgi:hypothetical protein